MGLEGRETSVCVVVVVGGEAEICVATSQCEAEVWAAASVVTVVGVWMAAPWGGPAGRGLLTRARSACTRPRSEVNERDRMAFFWGLKG